MATGKTIDQLAADLAALTARVTALESALAALTDKMAARWEWLMDTHQSHLGGYTCVPPLPPWW